MDIDRGNMAVDRQFVHEANPGLDMDSVQILQAVLHQAVSDCIQSTSTHSERWKAYQWLTDEDNPMLQLCLNACNINYERLLLQVTKKAWNLSL